MKHTSTTDAVKTILLTFAVFFFTFTIVTAGSYLISGEPVLAKAQAISFILLTVCIGAAYTIQENEK